MTKSHSPYQQNDVWKGSWQTMGAFYTLEILPKRGENLRKLRNSVLSKEHFSSLFNVCLKSLFLFSLGCLLLPPIHLTSGTEDDLKPLSKSCSRVENMSIKQEERTGFCSSVGCFSPCFSLVQGSCLILCLALLLTPFLACSLCHNNPGLQPGASSALRTVYNTGEAIS